MQKGLVVTSCTTPSIDRIMSDMTGDSEAAFEHLSSFLQRDEFSSSAVAVGYCGILAYMVATEIKDTILAAGDLSQFERYGRWSMV